MPRMYRRLKRLCCLKRGRHSVYYAVVASYDTDCTCAASNHRDHDDFRRCQSYRKETMFIKRCPLDEVRVHEEILRASPDPGRYFPLIHASCDIGNGDVELYIEDTGVDLFDHLFGNPDRNIAPVNADEEYMTLLFLGMAEALQHLHRIGYMHRDLKPENFTVMHDAHGMPHVKIIDFGQAVKIPRDEAGRPLPASLTQTSAVGTMGYLASEVAQVFVKSASIETFVARTGPERTRRVARHGVRTALRPHAHARGYGFRADTAGLGLTFTVMLTRKPAYDLKHAGHPKWPTPTTPYELDNFQLLEIMAGNLSPAAMTGLVALHADWLELISEMVTASPDNRLSLQGVIRSLKAILQRIRKEGPSF